MTLSAVTQARYLHRQGDAQAALVLLRAALRTGQLSSTEFISVGKLANTLMTSCAHDQRPFNVLVLGQCTTTWLLQAIAASALQASLDAVVTEGAYGNVLQTLTALDEAHPPDLLVLVPWNTSLTEKSQIDATELIESELAFWRHAWQIAKTKNIKRLVQVGYDWMHPGSLGFHQGTQAGNALHNIQQLNRQMRNDLSESQYFLPLEEISGMRGRNQFYDMRSMHWTKQPFSEAGLVDLSKHIAAGMRALTTGPKKVLVVDLDNTLWGGVVGEVGVNGIELGSSPAGEAFKAFQHHLAGLSQRGIALAVCSKNNMADAREVFLCNSDMVLRLEDIACFIANWDTKPNGIQQIAQQLNVGLESIVFFDDNVFERNIVRSQLPQVEVVEVPEEPSEYVNALQAGLWFETCALTDEDLARAQSYQARAQASATQASFKSIDDYLSSLCMQADVRVISAQDLQRVTQLFAKTNQFNLTTKRYTTGDIEGLLDDPKNLCLSFRLKDRFVDHGLVAIMIAIPRPAGESEEMTIDSFLMSCRVIGRTAEVYMLAYLLRQLQNLQFKRLVGIYAPTSKNALVANLYTNLGFIPSSTQSNEIFEFFLDLPAKLTAKTFVSEKD